MEDWRNEKMGEQGAGSSTMSARSTPPLEPKTAALVGVAAAIAAGETAELEARLGAARGAGVPVLWIEELLLQSLLVVGYPLARVAFGVWRKWRGCWSWWSRIWIRSTGRGHGSSGRTSRRGKCDCGFRIADCGLTWRAL